MSEITYDYVRDYLHAILPEEKSIIAQIREEALTNNVPIIKEEVKNLLEVLMLTHKPKRILEIGTAVGYSSLLMSQYLPEDGRITTIERSEVMIAQARKNIKKADKEKVITIMEGDAEGILSSLDQPFDMIFMDAAKGQYMTFLPHCIRLLKVGGLLISDNVLQNGLVAKSRFSIPRRQRTIHQRMREYLWEINHHLDLKSVILPINDGWTISYKLPSRNNGHYERSSQ